MIWFKIYFGLFLATLCLVDLINCSYCNGTKFELYFDSVEDVICNFTTSLNSTVSKFSDKVSLDTYNNFSLEQFQNLTSSKIGGKDLLEIKKFTCCEEFPATFSNRSDCNGRKTYALFYLSTECAMVTATVPTSNASIMYIVLPIVMCIIVCFIIGGVVHCVRRKKTIPNNVLVSKSRSSSANVYTKAPKPAFKSRSNSSGSHTKVGPPYYKHVHTPKPVSPPINRNSRPISTPIDEITSPLVKKGSMPNILDVSTVANVYESPRTTTPYELPRSRAPTVVEMQLQSYEAVPKVSPLVTSSNYDIPTSLPVYDEIVDYK